MSEIVQTDSEMARNAPVVLFTLHDGGKTIDYKVKALPIDRADEWMEKANEVEPLQQAVTDAQKSGDRAALVAARKAYNAALYECVFDYDPENVPRGTVITQGVSASQMARAFALMQMVNDPFVSGQLMTLNIQKEAMKGLPMKLIEKQMTGNGVTKDS